MLDRVEMEGIKCCKVKKKRMSGGPSKSFLINRVPEGVKESDIEVLMS